MNVKPLTNDNAIHVKVPSWLREKLAEQRLDGEKESEQVRRILINAVVTGGPDA